MERKVWKAAFACIIWTMWKQRNKMVFEEGVLNIQK